MIVSRVLRDRVERAREVVGRVRGGSSRRTGCRVRLRVRDVPRGYAARCSPPPRRASGGELSFRVLDLGFELGGNLRIPPGRRRRPPLRWRPPPLLLLRMHPWQRPKHRRRAIGIPPPVVSIVPCYFSCERSSTTTTTASTMAKCSNWRRRRAVDAAAMPRRRSVGGAGLDGGALWPGPWPYEDFGNGSTLLSQAFEGCCGWEMWSVRSFVA